MKVGYFVETPVEKNLTGGSRSFLDLIEQLKPMGIDPYVVVSEPWALTEQLNKMGILYITSKMYRPFIGVETKSKFYRIKYLIKLFMNGIAKKEIVKFLKINNVQLVHINSQFCGVVGAEVANKLKTPYVYHIREFLTSDFGVAFYNQKYACKMIGGSKAIIAISESIRKSEIEKYPNTRIERIYNGLNFDKVGTSYTKRFQNNLIKLVIVGRVSGGKNQLEAVKAVELLVNKYQKKVKLYIVGYMGMDIYEIELKKYIDESNLQDSVELVPFVNNPSEIVKQCDIGLMCSICEAFGRVTIEYMLASLLTIGTNSGGTPELINDKVDGFLYELNNEDQLAEIINKAIENAEMSNIMIAKAHEKAMNEFSIKNTAQNIKRLYDDILQHLLTMEKNII